MQEVRFEEALEQILATDARYHRDAYHFLREALDFTQKIVARENADRMRHVTGQELLDGIRQFALNQFGPMTPTVFAEWGITECRDFGNLVFNMVEIGLLAKTQEDSRADFEGGYSFDDAFRAPYLPARKREAPAVAGGVKPA